MKENMARASGKRLAYPGKRSVVRFRRRGGSLGLGASNTLELMRQIERGFSFETLLRLEANSGVSLALLASVIGIHDKQPHKNEAPLV